MGGKPENEKTDTTSPSSGSPPRGKLPTEIQDMLDDEEKMWVAMQKGQGPESTDTNIRYAAYASRVRTILAATHRYVAYTSDIGESFRPVAHPIIVRSAYAVSWAYLVGDVSYEGYKAYRRNTLALESNRQPVHPLEDFRTIMVQRAIFQGVASMGLPAFTIHSIVRYSSQAMKKSSVKSPMVRIGVPIGLGLGAIPFLPYVFDEPVEKAVEWAFEKGSDVMGYPPLHPAHQSVAEKVVDIVPEPKPIAQQPLGQVAEIPTKPQDQSTSWMSPSWIFKKLFGSSKEN